MRSVLGAHPHNANVLMIGDTAHAALPTTRKMAEQALEDGWCLARLLADPSMALETKLARFTASRQPTPQRLVMAGCTIAKLLFSTDSGQCVKREANASKADYAAMAEGMAAAWSDGLPIGV